MKYCGNYFINKWTRAGDKAIEQRKAERSIKKFRKKCMIETYGYDYYLRDKLWEKLKKQKKRDTYESWKKRLAIYGFTVHGFDTKRNQQHYGKPLVHQYNFYDFEDNMEVLNKGDSKMNKLTWNDILKSYTDNPRDVITRENGIWFYAYGEGNKVYIESGRSHENCSIITLRRLLDSGNFEEVYDMYLKKAPREEVCAVTQNSSYWFGIFSELSD